MQRLLYGFFFVVIIMLFCKNSFYTSIIFHILLHSKNLFHKPLIQMTYKRELTYLQSSIQTLIKTGANTKELADLQELLPLLKKAIQAEDKVLEVETDAQINSGYQTQLKTEATVDPKYKDIKEIQQFLYEDNIRDTNPILILSFNKLIGLTIDYLQNLEGMLKVISANSHKDDSISNSIKAAILDLFTGNDVNSYDLNEHIRTVLGQIIDDIFNGQGSVSLTSFCDGLAFEVRDKLIKPFQTTAKKQLKKNFGKKFRKHKKSPYPSISKILTAIDLYDIPHNVQGDLDKERRISNLAIWYSDFLQRLLKFETKHQTDFLNNSLLQKGLKGFGSSLVDKITPPSCKLHLVDNIVNKLGTKPILKSGDLVSSIKVELDALRLKVKTNIESGNFEGTDDLEHFLGLQAENYFDFIRTSLEKNRFDEYKKIIKDWIISLDKLMNKLGIDQERGKYNYKSKVIALNLSKLFNIEHDLIDFSSFIKKIIAGVKATGFSLELSEIDTLFSSAVSEGNIYTKLIDLYNVAIEKGTFDSSLDTLETTLPTMTQISHAILRAKIDLILNREVQFLTLEWELNWRNRDNVMALLVDFAVDLIQIPDLIRRFGDFLSREPATTNLSDYIEWFEINIGAIPGIGDISFSIPVLNMAQMLVDTIRATIGENIESLLDSLANIVDDAMDNARNMLRDSLRGIGGNIDNSTISLSLPVKLGLGLGNNGKPFAFGFIDSTASSDSIYSIVDRSPYELDCLSVYSPIQSDVSSSKDKKVQSKVDLKFNFSNPGLGISVGLSALFVNAGGSIIISEKEVSLNLSSNLTSTFTGNTVQINLDNIPTFNPIQQQLVDNEGELNSAPIYIGGTRSLTFKAFN